VRGLASGKKPLSVLFWGGWGGGHAGCVKQGKVLCALDWGGSSFRLLDKGSTREVLTFLLRRQRENSVYNK